MYMLKGASKSLFQYLEKEAEKGFQKSPISPYYDNIQFRRI